jgi:8-oxo-dGTP diphosphatase
MPRGPLTMLPKAALGILHEVSRHLLKRPVTGIVAAAHTEDGRWVLIRRSDTGTWALPGGTLEWGEMLRAGLKRELEEEAGIESFEFERVVGIYSRPDRDIRFHAVTVVALCKVALPTRRPMNSLEIRDVGVFADADVPEPLAMGMSDMLRDARLAIDGAPAILE